MERNKLRRGAFGVDACMCCKIKKGFILTYLKFINYKFPKYAYTIYIILPLHVKYQEYASPDFPYFSAKGAR